MYCLYPSEFSIGFPCRASVLNFVSDPNLSTSESFETLLAWKYSTLRLENSSKAYRSTINVSITVKMLTELIFLKSLNDRSIQESWSGDIKRV